MNSRFSLNIVAASTLLLGVRAHAQALTAVAFTIDERGVGSYSIAGGPAIALIPGLFGDPNNGVGGIGFGYTFPSLPVISTLPIPTVGDMLLVEPPQGGLSDVVRFSREPGAAGTLFFYSDNLDGIDALADTFGLPSNLLSPNVTLTEVGPEEGPNGVVYHPTLGLPGDLTPFGYDATYTILSDVPEASQTALGFMLGIFGLSVWRARNAKAD